MPRPCTTSWLALAAWLSTACVGTVVDGADPSGGGDDDSIAPDGGLAGTDGGAEVDPSAELYAPDALPRFDLELAADQIAALEADPYTYARGTFRYGAEVLADVGVRLKGEYTFRPLTQKASFKLKFDEFVPNRRFRGLRRMTFNNAFEDPSFVAERLTYLAFRNAGLPAPRANSALVYVNGEPYGLYVNIETEDKTFLARWFGSNDGNLYEEAGEDWHRGNEGAFDLETNELANDRSDLSALFAAVEDASDETLLEDVAHILDTDRFLRFCALEGLVNQWDGYAYTRFDPNNYRLYHDPSTGKFSLLPWGMDMSMKPLDGELNVDVRAPAGYFLQRCLASASCTAAYTQVLGEEADRFEALQLDGVAEQAYAQVRDAVYADPRKEHDDGEFEAVFDVVVDFARQRPAAVRDQL